MQIEQRQLWGSRTQLGLRPHGLYVCQRQAGGRKVLELEIPYEEVLPLQAEHQPAPRRPLSAQQQLGLIVVLQLLIALVSRHLTTWQFWGFLAGVALAMAALLLYGWLNWMNSIVLTTSQLSVTLTDRPQQRVALQQFFTELEQRAKAYLRLEYADIDPLGPIEPQLRRLRWLRELGVLTETEARIRTTRLTGRLSLDTLRGMGQDLETPYVN